MADELIDVVDENNQLLGITEYKSVAHKKGLWHRSAHVWVYNTRSEILLQLRATDKELYPDLWDISVAGHVGAGEDAVTAALREAEEEISLPIREADLKFWTIRKAAKTVGELKDNEFSYVYFHEYDGDVDHLSVQEEEVQSVRFTPMVEIEQAVSIGEGNYVPHGIYWSEVLDVIRYLGYGIVSH